MLFRTDLPINYRDEKSSGKRKRELIQSLAGSKGPGAPSHICVCSHVSARPSHWHCHLLPPLPQGTPSGPQLTPRLSLLLCMGCPPQPPLLGSWLIHADCCPWAWRGCLGLREGRELGTSCTWVPLGLQGGGGRQETRSLVSIPSLPWGAPSPGRWAIGEELRGSWPLWSLSTSSSLVLAWAPPPCGGLTGESVVLQPQPGHQGLGVPTPGGCAAWPQRGCP